MNKLVLRLLLAQMFYELLITYTEIDKKALIKFVGSNKVQCVEIFCNSNEI